MKHLHRNLLTHAICLAIGIGLAISIAGLVKADAESARSDQRAAQAKKEVIPPRPGAARNATAKDAASKINVTNGWKAADFREAWNAIAARDLTIAERLQMQIGVLRQWAMVDMEGAMRAALGNAWDGDTTKGGIGPLMVAFDDAFKAQPLAAWDLLQSGKLGVGTELFRHQWVVSATETEPIFVFSVAAQIPNALRMYAIQCAMRSAAKSPELKDEMLRKLSDLPQNGSADTYIAIAFNALPANEGNAAEIRQRLGAATNERAKTLLLHEFTSTLRDASAEVISSEWSKMTPEMQSRAAVAFFNSQQGTKNATAVLDMLISTDQWSTARAASMKLNEYGRSTSQPEVLAAWGMTLPDRPEAADLFRRSIEPLISRNNPIAQQWIESLPPGDWRTERALYTYTQNAIYARNDERLFEWAVERIVNPDLKAAAIRSRDDWARQRGLEAKAK